MTDDAKTPRKATKRAQSGYAKIKKRVEDLEAENESLRIELVKLQAQTTVGDATAITLLRRWCASGAQQGTITHRESIAYLKAHDSR